MKMIPIETGTLDWAKLHVGLISAGEADNLFTSKMEPRDGDMPKTFLYTKTAEKFRGEPMVNLSPKAHASSWQMEQGLLMEEEILPWYSLTRETKITRGFFCQTDDGLAGCTPDGLIGEDGGIETKYPEPHTHVKYVLNGKVPTEYIPQVQFSLFVTGRPWWEFVSYRRRFPTLVVRVEREEATMQRIGEAVAAFHDKLNEAVNRLKQLRAA